MLLYDSLLCQCSASMLKNKTTDDNFFNIKCVPHILVAMEQKPNNKKSSAGIGSYVCVGSIADNTVEMRLADEISVRGVPDRVKEQSLSKMPPNLIVCRRYFIVLFLFIVLLRFSLANVENDVLVSTNHCSSKKHFLDGIQFSAAVFQVMSCNIYFKLQLSFEYLYFKSNRRYLT